MCPVVGCWLDGDQDDGCRGRDEGAFAGLVDAGRQVQQLLSWAEPFEAWTTAVESAAGLGYLLAHLLVAAGETVLDLPAILAAWVRVLASGSSSKNDRHDARSVALAALRSLSLLTDIFGVGPIIERRKPQAHGSNG